MPLATSGRPMRAWPSARVVLWSTRPCRSIRSRVAVPCPSLVTTHCEPSKKAKVVGGVEQAVARIHVAQLGGAAQFGTVELDHAHVGAALVDREEEVHQGVGRAAVVAVGAARADLAAEHRLALGEIECCAAAHLHEEALVRVEVAVGVGTVRRTVFHVIAETVAKLSADLLSHFN